LETPELLTEERKQQIARSIVPPFSSFGGAEITGGAPAWIGPQSVAFVSTAGLHAAAIGLTSGSGGIGDRGGVFAGNYARLSGTLSFFISAGLVGVPGLSFDLQASRSSTDTTTDTVDMNGDGVLDVITPARTTLGALTASASGGGATAFDIGDQV